MDLETNKKIIEDALIAHYPKAKLSIFPVEKMDNMFHVSLRQDNVDFTLFAYNNYIHSLQSNADEFDYVQGFSNIKIKSDDLEIINEFIKKLYEESDFKKVVSPLSLFKTDHIYFIDRMDELNFAMIRGLAESSKLYCRLDKNQYSIILNSYFKLTKNKEMVRVPTINIIFDQKAKQKFEIAFNITKGTAHLVDSYSVYYEDFFVENKIFDTDKNFDLLFKSFIDDVVMKKIDPTNELKQQLDLLGDDLDEKVRLLIMYSI